MTGTAARGADRIAVTRIEPSSRWHSFDLSELWRYRELLYFLCWRAVKVRYKQAAIGVGWVLLQPLLTMAVFTLIFGVLVKMPSQGVPYPLFALTGLLPWTYFAAAVNRGGTSLVGDAGLWTKVYFPRVLIPLAACTTPLVDFLLSFVLLIALMAWYSTPPTWNILAVPLLLAFAWLSGLAVSLWLAPLNVRYRDVAHALPFVTQLWMYASPVVYPPSLIPDQWGILYGLNPMVGVIEGFRWALLGHASPDLRLMGVSGLTVLVILLGGSVYFRRMERTFADIV